MFRSEHWALIAALSVVLTTSCTRTPTEKFLLAMGDGKGTVPLPPGGIELENPIVLGPGVNGLQIVGNRGDVVRAKRGVELRAFFICRECKNVTFRDFSIEGDPAARARPAEAP